MVSPLIFFGGGKSPRPDIHYWDNFNVDIDSHYFALVFNIDSLVFLISARSEMDFYKESGLKNPFELAKKEGFIIKNLDDYLAFADHIMKKFFEYKAVSFKNALAYSRTIDFQNVPFFQTQREIG